MFWSTEKPKTQTLSSRRATLMVDMSQRILNHSFACTLYTVTWECDSAKIHVQQMLRWCHVCVRLIHAAVGSPNTYNHVLSKLRCHRHDLGNSPVGQPAKTSHLYHVRGSINRYKLTMISDDAKAKTHCIKREYRVKYTSNCGKMTKANSNIIECGVGRLVR